jgi:hypothetical protein
MDSAIYAGQWLFAAPVSLSMLKADSQEWLSFQNQEEKRPYGRKGYDSDAASPIHWKAIEHRV